jgi:hypothetical protein
MYWQSAYAALQDWDQDWLLLLSRIEAANLNDQSLWGPPITDINAFVNSLFNEPDKPSSSSRPAPPRRTPPGRTSPPSPRLKRATAPTTSLPPTPRP